MARIRSIKPELWLSPQVMNLSHSARLMFLGLITQADDEGRGLADTRRLKAAIFPGDDCKHADVEGWLAEVAAEKLAILYTDSTGAKLYQLTGWHSHQRVPKAMPSNYEPPQNGHSGSTTGTLPERYRNATGGSEGSEGKGRESVGGAKCATRLTDDFGLTPERRAVAEAERLPADRTFAKFCDYWKSASGSKAKKLDWDATWRNWCRTEADRALSGSRGGAVPLQPKPAPTEAEISEARRQAAADNRKRLRDMGLSP